MNNSSDEPGLLDALSRLRGSLFGAVHTRLELASIEVGEAGARLVVTLIASFAVVLLLASAMLALSAWVALTLWPTVGNPVLGWIALTYVAAGAGLLMWLRGRLHREPPLLAETFNELRHDAALMRGDVQGNMPGDGSGRPPRH